MATENLFSTPRENNLTGKQMLENAINRKQMQRQNMKALIEANKLANDQTDFTATMESANIESENRLQKDLALENASYAIGAKNIARHQLGMKPRLVREGTEQVFNKVIGEIIYESYWLDEPVKESTVDQIEDSIGQILCYIEDKCPGSKVPVEKHNKLLKNVYSAIESVVKEAAERITEEAKATNSAFSEFELNQEEESKLDDKLVDLGKDEIVELIKDKVAQVIQDEKERGKERAQTFMDIDNEIQDNEEDMGDLEDGDVHGEDGEETEANESYVPSMEELNKSKSVKEAMELDPTDGRYTANERYISGILEAGAPFNAFEDPSWNEFKSFVSLYCKKIKNILLLPNPDSSCCALTLINKLSDTLSSVPEDVPGDVKQFVMSMVSLIYGTVPSTEVIISRMGSSMGSPDLASSNNSVNYMSISWTDLLVNIKTNLASIKNYLENKCSGANEQQGNIAVVDPISTFESSFGNLVNQKRNRILNNNIGSTLFESIMIGNIADTEKVAMESAQNFESDQIENAALIESLLHYTVFETLSTIGLYNFRLDDIKEIKKGYMSGVSEGVSPIYGDSDSQIMSGGKDKSGKKRVRINTRKMKFGSI